MISLQPPPQFVIDPPAIIRPLERGVWADLDHQMVKLGLERHVRRAVAAEMRKVLGSKPAIVKATAAEMARYGKDPALASMLINPFIYGGGGVAGPVVTFRGVGDTSTSFNIGTATADRVVIAATVADRGATSPRTLTGLTYDGAAGSSLVTTGVGGTTNSITVGMSSKLITSGTTVTMAATYSGGVAVSKIYVFTITGQLSNTPGDTKTWKTGEAASTINVANAGCVIMVAAGIDGTLAAMTLTGVNSNDDQTFAGIVSCRGAAGSVSNLVAEAARSLAVSSTANAHAFVAHTYS